MGETLKLKVLKITQPIGEFYLAKIDALKLLKMSTVDRRHIDEDDEVIGIQRPLRNDKIREIKKYLTTQNATFPNSVIVNVSKSKFREINENEIELMEGDDTFTIIDGQHRLFGFDGYSGQTFELVLTIFVGLEIALQAEVFSIINSQQTKVDPTLNINLELADKTENPRKMLVQIVQSFNIDKDSPWYNAIKMLGNQSKGIISLAAFAKPLFNLTYPEKDLIAIKKMLNEKYPNFPDFSKLSVDVNRYPFWPFYASQKPSVIYKILFNYFTAFRKVLSQDWLNDESILNKTSGYNAMLKLLPDILPLGVEKGNLTEVFFLETLAPLEKMTGTITSEIYGSSGLYSSNKLYRDMKDVLRLGR